MSRKFEIVMTTLNKLGEEERVIKKCRDIKEVDAYISEHEQEFADNPDKYTIYVR